MKVQFLVSVGKEVGLGHFMRCRSIMRECRVRGWEIGVVLFGALPDKIKDVSSLASEVSVVEVGLGRDAAVRRSCEMAVRSGCSCVVVDGYDFYGRDLYDSFHDAGMVVMMLDDIADRDIPADVILNTGTLDAALYEGGADGQVLLGPVYALVDHVFDPVDPPFPLRHIERVLVSFGGVDRNRWTEATLAALERQGGHYQVDVVAGTYFDRRIQTTAGGPQSVVVHEHVHSLARLMCRADLLVTGAGATSWEGCRMGLPMVAVIMVDNQKEVGRILKRSDAAIVVDGARLTQAQKEETLHGAVAEACTFSRRVAMSENARALVDGKGPARVCDVLARAVQTRGGTQ